jgi:1,4-alpha-glucan branching enzyme
MSCVCRLFNYGHMAVQRFLLSNARWWVEEFRVDGYRFDGITSVLYRHHGLGAGFGGYDSYFAPGVADEEGQVYLMLANELLHEGVDPPVLTIAEDVSGQPGVCRPVREGGVGFDLRLAMAIPDKWIELMKARDEAWDMGNVVFTLCNRRADEPCVAYAESHDQALVGDKTLFFWLVDAAAYTDMSTLDASGAPAPPSPAIARGLALHKMIRLLTCALGGEAYLNFVGNEFGHPEWVDFPREGNAWSFHYCRRQWHLLDDPLLRYRHLAAFDRAMHLLQVRHLPWLVERANFVSVKHERDKVIVFDRGRAPGRALIFCFNFHPLVSFPDYPVPAPFAGRWAVVLSSDDLDCGGFGRVAHDVAYHADPDLPLLHRPASFRLYLPARTCVVLAHTP